jgi:hypothetical protein
MERSEIRGHRVAGKPPRIALRSMRATSTANVIGIC